MTHHANHANAESTRSTLRGIIGCLHPKTCPAPHSLSWGGATARQGGDSPNGPFPGPSSCGVFPGPQAGAAATLATQRSVAPSRGARARKEHRGRSIQGLGISHPQARAARASSSLSSHRSVQRLADRHARDFASTHGLGLMGGWDPESVMPTHRNLPQLTPASVPPGGFAPDADPTDALLFRVGATEDRDALAAASIPTEQPNDFPQGPLADTHSSRGAVTRRVAGGRSRANASALTATAAQNVSRSAGRGAHLTSTDSLNLTGAPRPADLPAFPTRAPSLAPGTAASSAPSLGSGGEAPATDLHFATPAGAPRSAGLIQQSRSTKAARAIPVGNTEGEL